MNDKRFDIFEILEALQDGVYLTDKEGDTVFLNRSYERITGLNRDHLVGKNVVDLEEKGVFNHITNPEVVKTGRPVTFMQTNSAGRQLVVSGYPIYDKAQKEVLGVISVVRDIPLLDRLTEEVQYQRALIEQYTQDARKAFEIKALSHTIGSKMENVIALAKKLSAVDTTVLIMGETGVGKELIAKTLHLAGPRKNAPFFSINCAAIPDNLMESEMFGYDTGAFTGAQSKGKLGMFELANNGTLFLDEISEMPLGMQAKLLRVLQEKEIMRIGGKKQIKISTRIIAATNQDITAMVKSGTFRQDLYYRLGVATIEVPPLRERVDEIEPLACLFLSRFNAKHRRNVSLSPVAVEELKSYCWPGNVRQLENVIENLVIVAPHDEINACDLPETLSRRTNEIFSSHAIADPASGKTRSLNTMMDEVEKRLLEHYLDIFGNDVYRTAEELHCDRSTLQRKLRRHKISISRRKGSHKNS